MNHFWKWFLIVVAVLLVGGIGAILMLALNFSAGHALWMHPGTRLMPMARGFYPFPGYFLLRVLIPLLIVGLCVWIGVSIGKKQNGKNGQNRPAQSDAAPVVSATPSPEQDPVCSACGRKLEKDWTVCPYCGQHR